MLMVYLSGKEAIVQHHLVHRHDLAPQLLFGIKDGPVAVNKLLITHKGGDLPTFPGCLK